MSSANEGARRIADERAHDVVGAVVKEDEDDGGDGRGLRSAAGVCCSAKGGESANGSAPGVRSFNLSEYS